MNISNKDKVFWQGLNDKITDLESSLRKFQVTEIKYNQLGKDYSNLDVRLERAVENCKYQIIKLKRAGNYDDANSMTRVLDTLRTPPAPTTKAGD